MTDRDIIERSRTDAWSCDQKNRKACRDPHGCHCREITALGISNREAADTIERLTAELAASRSRDQVRVKALKLARPYVAELVTFSNSDVSEAVLEQIDAALSDGVGND